MSVEIKTHLRQHREELEPKVTQEALASAAKVTVQWLRRLENTADQPTSFTTANNLLHAINAERQTRGLTELALDDLGLTIV